MALMFNFTRNPVIQNYPKSLLLRLDNNITSLHQSHDSCLKFVLEDQMLSLFQRLKESDDPIRCKLKKIESELQKCESDLKNCSVVNLKKSIDLKSLKKRLMHQLNKIKQQRIENIHSHLPFIFDENGNFSPISQALFGFHPLINNLACDYLELFSNEQMDQVAEEIVKLSTKPMDDPNEHSFHIEISKYLLKCALQETDKNNLTNSRARRIGS